MAQVGTGTIELGIPSILVAQTLQSGSIAVPTVTVPLGASTISASIIMNSSDVNGNSGATLILAIVGDAGLSFPTGPSNPLLPGSLTYPAPTISTESPPSGQTVQFTFSCSAPLSVGAEVLFT